MTTSRKKRVVILGGGFGGVYTAEGLEKLRGAQDDFEIILVSRENYFVYQPMLPEIISGSIGIFDTVSPLRRLLHKTDVYVRDVEAIDLENRMITTSPGVKPVASQIPYDHLVLALGNVTDFRDPRLVGLAQHALPFKNLGDAINLRNHVIHVLEEAAVETNPALKQALLTFVVAGGGFSGVECIAELNDFVHRVARSYRHISPSEIRMVLMTRDDQILPELVEKLRQLAYKVLTRRGIDIRLNTSLAAATGDEALLQIKQGDQWVDDAPIPTKTLVSTVPSSPNPMIEALDLPKERGRIKVDARLQVEGSDHLWAVGDCASIPAPGGDPAKDRCPPTAQFASREGTLLAHNIVAALRGGQQKEFAFKGLGKMGGLGHHSAVAEAMGMQFHGLLAWLMWRVVYLMKLPGWDRQVRTALAWAMDLVLPPDIVQLKLDHGQGAVQEHYEPGETVFNQGDLGDRLYIIINGRCEVLRTQDGGEQMLCQLGPGEYFGEMALLNQTVRSATVRAIERLNVLSLSKREFKLLATHLPAIGKELQGVMEKRLQEPKQAATAGARGPAPESVLEERLQNR
jgi:NADH:quinone reductase (non-electrogenic)